MVKIMISSDTPSSIPPIVPPEHPGSQKTFLYPARSLDRKQE